MKFKRKFNAVINLLHFSGFSYYIGNWGHHLSHMILSQHGAYAIAINNIMDEDCTLWYWNFKAMAAILEMYHFRSIYAVGASMLGFLHTKCV